VSALSLIIEVIVRRGDDSQVSALSEMINVEIRPKEQSFRDSQVLALILKREGVVG
jgi:hypothetical protein